MFNYTWRSFGSENFKVIFHILSKRSMFQSKKMISISCKLTPLLIYPRNISHQLLSFKLFCCGRDFFLINFKIMFCWLANGRSMLTKGRLKNSDIFYPCIKITCSMCANPLLSNIAFTRLRRWMFIAFNPHHDLWDSWYPFPRAATTVWWFCLLLKLHRHLQSKLWIVVP